MKKVQQSGFTLVEIAIVLVIIGLLLGGVLKGQELINSAKVRSLNDKFSGVTAAWYAFQDRYRAVPGDYNQADVNISDEVTNGQGNGLVNTNGERGQAWRHLAYAGMISGQYTGNAVAQVDYACDPSRCPGNGFGAGMTISYTNEGGNVGNANELVSGRAIPVTILAELDRKSDDGLATSGNMRLGNGGGGWGGAAATACVNGTNYELTTPSDNCAVVIRNF